MNPFMLAPTTLPDTPPLEYIAAGTAAGYDAIALRIHPSPGLPFHPILGDRSRIAEIKRALADAPPLREVGSFYLQPDTAVSTFEEPLALAADFGARFVFLIGDDPEWNRQRQNFGAFCDLAARYGLSAFVEFVPQRPLG